MFDAKALLDQFLGGKNADGTPKTISSGMVMKGMAAGGLAAVLLGTKPGRKLATVAVKVGGAAALAGLAYKAWNDWQAAKQAPADPAQPMKDITPAQGLLTPPSEIGSDASLAVLRAMIAAAKSDGHIDETEKAGILGRLDGLELDSEARAFVMAELDKPLDIEAVVAAATTPEMAVEIYAASVLAIDPGDPAERAYLAMLAARLKLDPGLTDNIEREAAKVLA